ncbi:rod shape-determining protein RodA [Tenacibaculum piscium]|uniref:rod shape-determining protein RodA n=1 Tax=Tenacibaculum piscium TaxID=1458515 RepID=UPI001F2F57C5|nr:rod shape-determining protein RodA [Tenacibaculum piscium]
MRQERNNIFEGIDWLLVLLYVVLVGFGWMNIYASSSTEDSRAIFDFSTKYGKQFIFIGLSIPLIILILFFNSKFYERFASVLYVLSLVLLAGVFIFGKKINGATSWYNFGGIGLQPSEFSKAFTALALAKLISDRKYNFKLLKNQLKAFVLIFLPAFFIALQPDMGSVLIYFSFFFVLNREGLTLNYIVFGTVSIILFILTIYFGANWILFSCLFLITLGVFYGLYKDKRFFRFNTLKVISLYLFTTLFIYGIGYTYESVLEPHQKDRFDILLGKTTDLKNKGYNTYQSELTISSGGFLGKGFLQGDRTQGKFVPEQETDYIYSTVGEEWGFLGSTFVIILFMFLLYRIIYLAENQTNKFGRIYGYGIASIIFFHIVVNIGMVIGLLPTIGIPLPFFSYGGSSLWGFTVLLFIFIRLDAHKKYDF